MRIRTLHTSYRVSDLDVSLAFYTALGYHVVGRVDLDEGETLTMLKFPEEALVTLELVHRPAEGAVQLGTGFSGLAVKVENLTSACREFVAAGLSPEPEERPSGPDGPRTSWLTDPDGYRIELVQWPPGHADGLSEADFS